ncbi:hypothetical protein Poli38472_002411 [Pythium oligandrum]|uniref:Uncharacterized protein n=1 Tax=Pythium oligandrum TaxID=41045 RepID=A0A8K1CIS3_PYTOL|nr:hypothetical protein Poli38472_002411 [Pythium oligandrum]|eukprot:TMW63470.1 hypothetical protein Poli38472_002411 [Pythium oligandrum]
MIEVISEEQSTTLASALLAVDARQLDGLEQALVGAKDPQSVTVLVAVTAELRATKQPLSPVEVKALIRLVKAVTRIIVRCVRTVMAEGDDVNGFVHLDANLRPLMEFLVVVCVTFRLSDAQNATELLRWTPFVIHASVHFLCERLPAFDAMQCYSLAQEAVQSCQELHHASSLSDLFGMAIDQVVSLSSQDITKEDWVSEASIAKHVLEWIVVQVVFPRLGGEVLGRLLALVFPLVDDLTDATQLVGARMLRHVVKNVTATELRWYSDVLLEVLRVASTSRKADTLDPVLESLVVSLDKVSPPGDYQLYDRFVPRLLNDCSLCSEVALRVLYARHLRAVITRLGAPHSIHLIRYLQPLLKVLIASFEGVNATLIIETLETLRQTVLCAWPRIPSHTDEIFVGVLKAVALCEVLEGGMEQLPSSTDKKQILILCRDIFGLLHDLTRETQAIPTLLEQVIDESQSLKPFCEKLLAELPDRQNVME